MKVFVTGVNGQLGHDVMLELARRGHEAVGSGRGPAFRGFFHGSPVADMPYVTLDITDPNAVRRVLTEVRPDAVIHCAAWTAVDAAEEAQNRPAVFACNVTGTRNIALVCRALSCKMMYISTDYVFPGREGTLWPADSDSYAPLNYYGQTKLWGEEQVAQILEQYFIVRIAWVFGVNGNNFVRTMLKLSETHPTLRVVNDQIGTPTYTGDLCRLLVDMIQTQRYGRYHAANEGGFISWYDFACEIFRQAGRRVEVVPVSTREYGQTKAQRPLCNCLDKSKLEKSGFTPLPHWRDALQRYLKEIHV